MTDPAPSDRTEDFTTSGDGLDAGLAAAFGPDRAEPLPAGGSDLPWWTSCPTASASP